MSDPIETETQFAGALHRMVRIAAAWVLRRPRDSDVFFAHIRGLARSIYRVRRKHNNKAEPQSPTPTAERIETLDKPEPSNAEGGRLLAGATLLGDCLPTASSQKSNTLPWITQGTPVSALDTVKLRFSSISELLEHMEQYPASVAILERMLHHCVSLKDGLSLWQEEGRPYISWPGKDNLCEIRPQASQPTPPSL